MKDISFYKDKTYWHFKYGGFVIGAHNIDRIKTSIKELPNRIKRSDNLVYPERKMDFINYQFLLGQKNYFKRLFQHFDFHFSSSDSKRINPFLNRDSKKYINENSSLNPSRLIQNQKILLL